MRSEFLEAIDTQNKERKAYCLATVVRVEGSASAKTGSKALFSDKGKNLYGWIGGGCAESFIGEQSVEALRDGNTRHVWADLDDEVFGLGVACGGRMEIFIEPVYPPTQLRIPRTALENAFSSQLAKVLDLQLEVGPGDSADYSPFQILQLVGAELARERGLKPDHLRDLRDLPLAFQTPLRISMSRLVLLGKGRIVEAMAQIAADLGWPVLVQAPGLNASDFPAGVHTKNLINSYSELEWKPRDAVVIASHHSRDPEFVVQALKADASYVGMVGSRKRALDVISQLESNKLIQAETQTPVEWPLFAPAGLEIGAKTPAEIALSILLEIGKLNEGQIHE